MINQARAALAAVLVILLSAGASAKPFQEMFGGTLGFEGENLRFLESLDYRQGRIELPAGGAVIEVPAGYYFLAAEDAGRVMAEVWNHPPVAGTVGLLYPASVPPIAAGDGPRWGVHIHFAELGHVSDSAADAIASEALDCLQQALEEATRADSEWRTAAGYDSVQLVGWESQPFYDRARHSLQFAVEYRFGGRASSRINYSLAMLSRTGMLVMKIAGGPESLPQMREAVPAMVDMVAFKEGSRHEDHNSWFDRAADIGADGLATGSTSDEDAFEELNY